MNSVWSEEKIERQIKKGYGSVTGSEYKPWIHVMEGGSLGVRHRLNGWKTNRIHQLLSKLEYSTFLALEWCDYVVDIREQYPLERNKTQEIANRMGVNHSIYPTTNIPIVMTTDFLITVNENDKKILKSISVKPSEELEKPRVLEKLEIERQYWSEKGIDWGIVTEKDINNIFTENIVSIHQFNSNALELDHIYIDRITTPFVKGLTASESEVTLQEYFDKFERDNNLDTGSSISFFRYVVANKFVKIDMWQKVRFNKRISDLILN